MKALLLLLGFVYFPSLYAQNDNIILAKSNLQQVAPYQVKIEFTVRKETPHLLIVVSDISGRTLFLENRYHFKGNYTSTLDLKKAGKGSYHLLIDTDTEKIKKDFLVTQP